MPITPAVLTWARKHTGFSPEEATRKFPKMPQWESGRARPTYPELERVADAFSKPVAVFFFPEPPAVKSPSKSFRTLPEDGFERLPHQLRKLLNRATALQMSLFELHGGRNPISPTIVETVGGSDLPIHTLAARARSALGVSMATQQSWEDAETALAAWRTAFEEAGISVFKEAFRMEEVSGFCLYHEQFPVIYVNNSKPPTRQIFTLFHELGHVLFQTSGVDPDRRRFADSYLEKEAETERSRNRFAADCLLPPRVLTAELRGASATKELALDLAHRFHVSRELMFRRFLDRGLISSREYEAAVDEWTPKAKRRGSGGNWYGTRLAYLGVPYVRLVFSRLRQGEIDESAAADHLLIAPKNLADLEHRLLARRL